MEEQLAREISFADLEMLVAFASSEHFGRTAAELDVSTATVQRAIRALERKLGLELLEQAGRRVRLNHVGHVLVNQAHTVLRSRVDAVAVTLAETGRAHRLMRISHTYSLGLGFVPAMIARYLHQEPAMRFRCQQSAATQAVSALLRGEADMAVGSLAPAEPDLVVVPLFSEALMLAVPESDPLAKQDRVRLSQIRDRPFIAMEPGSSSRTALVNACARAGFVPRVTFEGSDLFVVESMVGAGIGISLVPEEMRAHQSPKVVRLPIDGPTAAPRTIFLAYPRSNESFVEIRALADIARALGKERSTPDAGTIA